MHDEKRAWGWSHLPQLGQRAPSLPDVPILIWWPWPTFWDDQQCSPHLPSVLQVPLSAGRHCKRCSHRLSVDHLGVPPESLCPPQAGCPHACAAHDHSRCSSTAELCRELCKLELFCPRKVTLQVQDTHHFCRNSNGRTWVCSWVWESVCPAPSVAPSSDG